MTKPITADDLFGSFNGNPEYEAELRRIEPQTSLAINVNLLRRERALTQEELARMAGMRQPRIAEIERGDGNPTLETLGRLASALGVSASELLADRSLDEEPMVYTSVQRLVLLEQPLSIGSSGWGRMRTIEASSANDNFALAG